MIIYVFQFSKTKLNYQISYLKRKNNFLLVYIRMLNLTISELRSIEKRRNIYDYKK